MLEGKRRKEKHFKSFSEARTENLGKIQKFKLAHFKRRDP